MQEVDYNDKGDVNEDLASFLTSIGFSFKGIIGCDIIFWSSSFHCDNLNIPFPEICPNSLRNRKLSISMSFHNTHRFQSRSLEFTCKLLCFSEISWKQENSQLLWKAKTRLKILSSQKGYRRPGSKTDGCAIFYRTEIFECDATSPVDLKIPQVGSCSMHSQWLTQLTNVTLGMSRRRD